MGYQEIAGSIPAAVSVLPVKGYKMIFLLSISAGYRSRRSSYKIALLSLEKTFVGKKERERALSAHTKELNCVSFVSPPPGASIYATHLVILLIAKDQRSQL